MNSKKSLVQTVLLSVAAIAAFTCCFVGTGSRQALADLDCANTVSGSTQQGAICLPSDPTGVTSQIPTTSVKAFTDKFGPIVAGFAMLIAIVFVIIGGYRYIFDGGNEEQAEKGKKTVVNALIGIVVILLSYVIVVVIVNTVSNLNTAGQSSTGGASIPSSSAATPAAPSSPSSGVTTSILCSDGSRVTYAAECGQ